MPTRVENTDNRHRRKDRLDDAGRIFQFSGRQNPVQYANGRRRYQQRQENQQVAPNMARHINRLLKSPAALADRRPLRNRRRPENQAAT